MKKSRKIVIGVESIVFLFGLYYLYAIYNTEPSTSYSEYCKETQTNCVPFSQICKNSGGKDLIQKRYKFIDNSEATFCFERSFSFLGIKLGCVYTSAICRCPLLKRWSNEKGCTYF